MTDEKHTERALLQRRIKNQRRALKQLNAHAAGLNLLLDRYRLTMRQEKSIAYRHAADLAESFWGGRRVAAYIRRWL